ncbi:MAG: NAD-dependent epimerase/dehydratase family protein [Candidatus Falkowbacteria bacterium]
MKILITGGSGKIGKKLINKLLEFNNYNIKVLSRNNNKNYNNIKLVVGDLLYIDSLQNALKEVNLVIHLAGLTHTNNYNLYYKINTIGTENLVKACENSDVKKIIYISSRTASNNGGAYAKSKLLAEEKIKNSSLDWVILSLSEVYGAGEDEFISKLINIIKKSYFTPIIGDGNYLLSPVHVDDVISCIINAINNGIINKKYIIAGSEEFTLNEIVDYVIKNLKVTRIKIHIPIILIKLIAFIFYLLKINFITRDQIPRLICKKPSDISLAKKELNFKPRNFNIC